MLIFCLIVVLCLMLYIGGKIIDKLEEISKTLKRIEENDEQDRADRYACLQDNLDLEEDE